MTATAILEIIRLNLAILLQLLEGMTPEQKSAAWSRHEQRMAFWEGLLAKVKDQAAEHV